MTPAAPAGMHCPGCGEHAALVITGQCAFCGNEDCRVLYWDPAVPVADQMADMKTVDLSPLDARPSFTCPACGMTSSHPDDVANRYCGNCHTFPENRGEPGAPGAPVT